MVLFQQAVDRGFLTPTPHDQVEFFTVIEHTTRVAMTNPGGFLRVIVEQGLWHHLTNTEEDAALTRLNRYHASQTDTTRVLERLGMVPTSQSTGPSLPLPIVLSDDAFRVQGLTQALARTQFKGDIFSTVQHHGHLPEWTRERWEHAEQEVAEAQGLLARQRAQAMEMTALEEIIGEDRDEEEKHVDWG